MPCSDVVKAKAKASTHEAKPEDRTVEAKARTVEAKAKTKDTNFVLEAKAWVRGLHLCIKLSGRL